jgi:hypothetical protein
MVAREDCHAAARHKGTGEGVLESTLGPFFCPWNRLMSGKPTRTARADQAAGGRETWAGAPSGRPAPACLHVE